MSYVTAMYLRLSVDDDNYDESESITSQRDILAQFISSDSMLSSGEILEFSDDGWSGTNFERPNVKKLLELARQGGIQCIVVKDLSRWGRNYIEVGEYIEHIFPFLGIRFISINERYDSNNYKGSTAPTDVAFNAIMHDIYCKELSYKVRQSYIDKAKKGEFLCGEAPFGFVKSKIEKNKLIIDEEAVAVIRRIFEMAVDGMSNVQIAAVLNSEEVDTPLMYRKRKGRALRGDHSVINGKGVWTDKNVRTIITDERYIGVQVSGKTRKPKPGSRKVINLPESEWIKVPGAHEPIVAEEVFTKANAGIIRCKKTATTQKSHALFAGKMRCGHCGHALRYQGGGNPCHFCRLAKLNTDTGCFTEKVYVEDIKPVVLAAVKTEAEKVFDIREKRKNAVQNSTAKATLKAGLGQTKTRLIHLEQYGITLYEDFADGKISKDTYLTAKADCTSESSRLEKRIIVLNEQIDSISEALKPANDEPLLRRVLDSTELTSEILSLVSCVNVYDPERIEVALSFGDTNYH